MATGNVDDRSLRQELRMLIDDEERRELDELFRQEAFRLDPRTRRALCRRCRWDTKLEGCYCVRVQPWDELT